VGKSSLIFLSVFLDLLWYLACVVGAVCSTSITNPVYVKT